MGIIKSGYYVDRDDQILIAMPDKIIGFLDDHDCEGFFMTEWCLKEVLNSLTYLGPL